MGRRCGAVSAGGGGDGLRGVLSRRRRLAVVLVGFFLAAAAAKLAAASDGDTDPAYKSCVKQCVVAGDCPDIHSDVALRLLQWDCESDCKYRCMRDATQARVDAGLPVRKFHGKWPFVRVFGCQELFSVLFSLLNLASHALGYLSFRHSITKSNPKPSSALPLGRLWGAYSAANCNLWLWSAVFHARDVDVTEKLDYISGNVALAVMTTVTIIRLLRLTNPWGQLLAMAISATALAQHVYYMLFVLFDYGFNVKASLIVGAGQALAWTVWVFAVNHPHRWRFLLLNSLLQASVLLEVLDFPPLWGLLDAHATWHLVTPPLVLAFWSFIRADAEWECGRLKAGKKGA